MASSLKFAEVFHVINNIYSPDGEKTFEAENIQQESADNYVSTDRSKNDGNIEISFTSLSSDDCQEEDLVSDLISGVNPLRLADTDFHKLSAASVVSNIIEELAHSNTSTPKKEVKVLSSEINLLCKPNPYVSHVHVR